MCGIGKKRGAEAMPLKPSIDDQAADAHRRQSGIARSVVYIKLVAFSFQRSAFSDQLVELPVWLTAER